MLSDEGRRRDPSRAVAAAGADHVRLFYDYLDMGDIDGCGSLFDDAAYLSWPQVTTGRGRSEVIGVHVKLAGPPTRHEALRIFASGDTVAATGWFVQPGRGSPGEACAVEFADFFTVSGDGLLLTHRRYYFVAPPC